MIRLKTYLFLLLFFPFLSEANLDTLRQKISKARNDSVRINLIYKQTLNDLYPKRVVDSLLGEIASFHKKTDCYLRFYAVYKQGQHYSELDVHSKSIPLLIRSLQIADSCNNDYARMLARNKLAYVDKKSENFKSSIKNSHYSLYYARKLNDSITLASNYTLLGNIYKSEMLLDSALYYHYQALAIREVQKDEANLALTYNNLGLAYKNKKEFQKALEFLRKSLVLKAKIKDKTLYAAYNNMSIVFKNMKLNDSSIYYSKKVVELGVMLKNGKALNEGLAALAETYDQMKNNNMAVHYYRRLRKSEDSVNKETINAQFMEMQSRYESDRKDADLKLKEESLKTAEALNSRKNILIWLSSVAFILAVVSVIVIFRSYRQSKQNALNLELKNEIIEEKNKEITDSINYARNIQQSLISPQSVFQLYTKEHFVLYMPKDIVSGDFYWASKVDHEFLVVCADCTGHGVPGAIMSVMGITFLNEIVNHKKITRPDLILNQLRTNIIDAFSANGNRDGMDVSVISIKEGRLQMAGANNGIWIIRNGTKLVLRPDKFPVGKYQEEITPFSLNTFELQQNDLILMYTDGYADQFGGPMNKKLKNKAIEQLVLENAGLPLEKMKAVFSQTFNDWKGKNEQVDDVLVIGIKV